MKIYKIGQSVKDRDLVAVEMWADDEMSDMGSKLYEFKQNFNVLKTDPSLRLRRLQSPSRKSPYG